MLLHVTTCPCVIRRLLNGQCIVMRLSLIQSNPRGPALTHLKWPAARHSCNARSNRNVFNWRLNALWSVKSWSSAGNAFHALGLACEKQRSPNLSRVVNASKLVRHCDAVARWLLVACACVCVWRRVTQRSVWRRTLEMRWWESGTTSSVIDLWTWRTRVACRLRAARTTESKANRCVSVSVFFIDDDENENFRWRK